MNSNSIKGALFILLFASLLFASPQTLFAQDDAAAKFEKRKGERERAKGMGLLRRLNLTPEQVGQMREIRTESEEEGRALLRRMNQARRALNEAIYSDSADEALITQRANELAEAQSAVTVMRAQVEWRIRRVLTPSQLSMLREMRQEAQGRRLRRQKRGGDEGPHSPADSFSPRKPRYGEGPNDAPPSRS